MDLLLKAEKIAIDDMVRPLYFVSNSYAVKAVKGLVRKQCHTGY